QPMCRRQLPQAVDPGHGASLLEPTDLPFGEPGNVGLLEPLCFAKLTNGPGVSSGLSARLSFMLAADLRIGVLSNGVEIDVNVRLRPPDPTTAGTDLECRQLVGDKLGQRRNVSDRHLETSWLTSPYVQLAILDRSRGDELPLRFASS